MTNYKKNLLTLKQLCHFLSTSESHIRGLVYKNMIPYKKVGKLLRFDLDQIQTWIEEVKTREGL